MKSKVSTFIKSWLLHFVVVWALVNFYDSLDFLNKRSVMEHYFQNDDGSPITVFQRLINHNFHKADFLYLLVFTYLVELCYQHLFKKLHWLVFTISAAAVAILFLWLYSVVIGHPFQSIVQPISVLTSYIIGYALIREFFHHKLYLLNVRLGKSQTELQVLKQQLDPHFLFNTLNYLYGTALTEKAERTAEGIDIMSGMMRYTVTGTQHDMVPLADEIHFIEQYIYLQKVRLSLSDPDPIKVKIDASNQGYTIAPMLLIPFIENAFKHGVSNEQPAEITVNITTKGTVLNMVITNAILTRHIVKGTQSGLSIAKKRLELLYPDQHQLQIRTDNNQYKVTLSLTLQSSK